MRVKRSKSSKRKLVLPSNLRIYTTGLGTLKAIKAWDLTVWVYIRKIQKQVVVVFFFFQVNLYSYFYKATNKYARSDWPRVVFAWEYVNVVLTSRCFAFRALITQARIWKRFWVANLDKFTSFTHFLVRWNMLCQFSSLELAFFSEKNPCFGKHFFCKTRISFVYKTSRLVRISLLISTLNKRVLPLFFRESYFLKAIENFFPVFAYPDINTQGVGRIRDSYANPRLCLGLA